MKKKIGADFFREYVNITDMKPNGKGLFTYVKYTTVMEEDKYLSDLYLYDMESKTTIEQLTSDGYVNANEWLDEENLIILGAREEDDKAEEEKGIPLIVFNKFNIRTKQYTKLFKLYHSVYKFCIIDENRYLMLASESPTRDQWLEEANGDWEQYLKIQERESKYVIADEVPFWSGSGDLCNKERYRAYLYDHGELTLLHDDSFSTWDIASYKDEYGIFYGLEPGGFQKSQGKLFKIDYQTKEVTAIDDSLQYIYTKIQPVDSNHILVCRNDCTLHGEYQDEYIDVIDLKTGNFTRNNKRSDWHLYDMVMTDISYLSGWLNKIVTTEDGFFFISISSLS